MRLFFTGRWMYDRTSTSMGVLYTDEGRRFDYGLLERTLEDGLTVEIRQAIPSDWEVLLPMFDDVVDSLAESGWVAGLGNFDPDAPPDDLQERVDEIKREARVEAGLGEEGE